MKVIEVFKTGTHTASNGSKKTYTEGDLDQIVTKYNEQTAHEAPLVIGHPKDNDPAFGWIKKLERVGQKMLAYVDQLSDEIIAANRRGEYKKISISLQPDGLLRHVGLLGAVPPAVKGLAPVSFATGDDYTEYVWATDEWRMPIAGGLFQKIREFFIEKFGREAADTVLPSEEIGKLHDAIQSTYIPLETNPEFTEREEAMEKELQEKFDKLNADFSELQGKYTTLTQEFTALKDERAAEQLAFAEKEKKTALGAAVTAFDAFCETLIVEGKVLAGEKPALLEEFQDIYQANQALSFAEGQDNLVEKFKKRLMARAVTKPAAAQRYTRDAKGQTGSTEGTGRFSCFSDVNEKDQELDKKATEYMEKHPEATYEQAMDVVLKS